MKWKHKELIFWKKFHNENMIMLRCSLNIVKKRRKSVHLVISRMVIFQKVKTIISPILILTDDESIRLCDRTIAQNCKKMIIHFKRLIL